MKVAIVCGSPSSEFLAPFENEDWEIWVLGNRYDRHKDHRVTRIFEIHDDLTEHENPNQYAKWLVAQNIPMVVGEGFPIKAQHVKVFPFDEAEALDKEGITLASSTAYMMAMAIMDGATDISVYGVDMAVDDVEYRWQRPCMWGWVKLARGMGINVTLPKESALFNFEYVEGRNCGGKPDFAKPPFTEKAFRDMVDVHTTKIGEYSDQIARLQQLIQTHDGCRQVYERMAKVARGVESGIENLTLTGTVTIK